MRDCLSLLIACVLLVGSASAQDERTIDELMAELQSPASRATREAAADALAAHGAAAAPSLIKALGHEDAEVRRLAARGLGALTPAPTGVRKALLAALHDPDLSVFEEAADALTPFDPEALSALFQIAVRWEDWTSLSRHERTRARRVQRRLYRAKPQSLDFFVSYLRAEDHRTRRLTVRLLSRTQDPAVVTALVEALNDDNASVRIQVLRTFGRRSGSDAVVEALLVKLEDADTTVRQTAIWCLAQQRGSEDLVVPKLAKLVREINADDVTSPEYALRALGAIKTEAAFQALISVLSEDKRANILNIAFQLLGQRGDPRAIPFLIQGLEAPELKARQGAIYGLAELGPAAAPAIPALFALPLAEVAPTLGRLGQTLKRKGKIFWWVPLRVYAGELSGAFVAILVWFMTLRRLVPRLKRSIRGLGLILLASLFTTATACAILYAFVPSRVWWNDAGVLLTGSLSVFVLMFLAAGRLVHSRHPPLEQLTWVCVVATAPLAIACCGVHYVLTQNWVQGFLPNSVFVVVPLHVAAVGSTAMCCLLVATWTCAGGRERESYGEFADSSAESPASGSSEPR